MPVKAASGSDIQLITKGMPFCVAGTGDLLALFRCISCRFAFGTTAEKPHELGAPGRVFISREAELACNVQAYPRDAYLRRAEAEQCRIQSSMLLPVFLDSNTQNSANNSILKKDVVGIIEVVQTSDDMAFLPVADLLQTVLQKSGLSTVDLSSIRLPVKASHIDLPFYSSIFERHSSEGKAEPSSDKNSEEIATKSSSEESFPVALRKLDSQHDENNLEKRSTKIDIARKKVGRGSRVGAELTLRDLQNNFGLGLKEAASHLGVCTTTLKRACRRHGIQRWPRRALQKVSKALDDIEKRGVLLHMTEKCPQKRVKHNNVSIVEENIANKVSSDIDMEKLDLTSSKSYGLVDLRWNALANLIPHLNVPAWLDPSDIKQQASASHHSLPEGALAIDNGKHVKPIPENIPAEMESVVASRERNIQTPNVIIAGNIGAIDPPNDALESAILPRIDMSKVHNEVMGFNPFACPEDTLGAKSYDFNVSFGVSSSQDNGKKDRNEVLVPSMSLEPSLSFPGLDDISLASLENIMPDEKLEKILGDDSEIGAMSGAASGPDDVGLLDSTLLEMLLKDS